MRTAVATAAAVGVAAMGGDDGGAAEALTGCLSAGYDAEHCNVALADCLESCGDNDEECNVEHCVANYDLELCSNATDTSASEGEGEGGGGSGGVVRRGGGRGMAAAREAMRTSGGALAATMDGARATILDGMQRLTALCDQVRACAVPPALRVFPRVTCREDEAMVRRLMGRRENRLKSRTLVRAALLNSSRQFSSHLKTLEPHRLLAEKRWDETKSRRARRSGWRTCVSSSASCCCSMRH